MSVKYIQSSQDETRKDRDSKLMTFIGVQGHSFCVDIFSQTSKWHRSAGGIAERHDDVVGPYLDKGCQLIITGISLHSISDQV